MRQKELAALVFICIFVGVVAGFLLNSIVIGDPINNEICMEDHVFNNRQLTLIYCDMVYGNCFNLAQQWFEENPDWLYYNVSLENVSWFDDSFFTGGTKNA